MRLLKTRSRTSERRGYEADKTPQAKREIKEAYPQEAGKNVKENHRHTTWKGGAGRKRVDGKPKNRSSATPAARGDEAKYITEKEKKNTVLCHSRSGKNTQKVPGPEGRGSAGRKNEGTTPSPAQSGKKHPKPSLKETVSFVAVERPDYPDQPRH